jgi:hypothetical protein
VADVLYSRRVEVGWFRVQILSIAITAESGFDHQRNEHP